MLRMMREQVQSVLGGIPAKRRPALRRCDAPDALLATDLPFAADAAEVQAFCARMNALGWKTRQQSGWILLDAPVPAPAEAVPASLEGECGCCISLLLRHREEQTAAEYIRAVVKAAEAGKQPFDRLCGQLHAEFAVRLRLHEPLPGALLPYLCHVYHALYE